MKKSTFIEGTITATLAIVLVKILGMLYVIPFYALVGVQGSALYAYAYNIYVIFLDTSTAGFPLALSKLINEYNTLGKMEAKVRAYKLGRQLLSYIALAVFLILFFFARPIAQLLIGDLKGGNTIADVTFVIKCVSFAILIVPFLCASRGYLQGHKIISISSYSQVIEQLVRIAVILGGSYLILEGLNMSLKTAIGVAVLGAFWGGIAAYIYIIAKIRKHKKEIGFGIKYPKDDISNKEIIKKIFKYAIPFIITSGVASVYTFVNMVFILRTMNYLHFSAIDVEFVASAITTWAPKINMIVTSMAVGMTISLIPTIVSAYALKNWPEINHKLNQALQGIIFISIPMAIGISLLSRPIWSVFYGLKSSYGPAILASSVLTSIAFNVYLIVMSTLQGINKFKLVYKTTIFGFALNALLDIPLMLIFNKIGLPAFFGAILATAIGYGTSACYALISLKREYHINYKKTWLTISKVFIPTSVMIISVLVCKALLPYNAISKGSCVFYILINALVGATIYIASAHKLGLINKILGEQLVNNILRKLTFGKYSKLKENN